MDHMKRSKEKKKHVSVIVVHVVLYIPVYPSNKRRRNERIIFHIFCFYAAETWLRCRVELSCFISVTEHNFRATKKNGKSEFLLQRPYNDPISTYRRVLTTTSNFNIFADYFQTTTYLIMRIAINVDALILAQRKFNKCQRKRNTTQCANSGSSRSMVVCWSICLLAWVLDAVARETLFRCIFTKCMRPNWEKERKQTKKVGGKSFLSLSLHTPNFLMWKQLFMYT